jgi:hypothetical protein
VNWKKASGQLCSVLLHGWESGPELSGRSELSIQQKFFDTLFEI